MKITSNNMQGIAYMLAFCAFGTLSDTIAKYITLEGYSSIQILFIRSILVVTILLPILIKKHQLSFLKTDNLPMYAGRALFTFMAMWLWFALLKEAPMTKFIAIGFSATLITSFLAILVLGEKYTHYKTIALIIGFIGILVVIRPGIIPMNKYLWLTLVSALFWSIGLIFLKKLSDKEPVLKVTFFLSLMFIPLSAIFAFNNWIWPTLNIWMLLLVFALISSVTMIFLTLAFSKSDVTTLMPFDFSALLFAAIYSYILFDEFIDLWTLIGGAIIFSSGYYIISKEKQKHIPEELEINPDGM